MRRRFARERPGSRLPSPTPKEWIVRGVAYLNAPPLSRVPIHACSLDDVLARCARQKLFRRSRSFSKREPRPHFVPRPGCVREALVEQKLGGGESGELRRRSNARFQTPNAVFSAAIPRQRNVRMIGPLLRPEPALARCSDHALLERNKFRRKPHPGEEDA